MYLNEQSEYKGIIVDSLAYCQENKGLEIYAWCIMSNHLHLIMRAKGNNPAKVLGSFKDIFLPRFYHDFKLMDFPLSYCPI